MFVACIVLLIVSMSCFWRDENTLERGQHSKEQLHNLTMLENYHEEGMQYIDMCAVNLDIKFIPI